MYGAILGDIIGSSSEFDMGGKTKDFPFFVTTSQFTDDTVITIAVVEALIDTMGELSENIKAAVLGSCRNGVTDILMQDMV